MKRKFTQFGITLFLFMILFLCYKITLKIIQREKDDESVQTMPGFKFAAIDGQLINSSSIQKNTLIVFFNSECESCNELTQKIIADTLFVRNTDVIMVSTENQENLNLFKSKFKIDSTKIHICNCDYQNFASLFGSHLRYPSMFLYSTNKKLVRKSTGSLSFKELSHLKY